MKKTIILALTLVLVTGLFTACGNNANQPSTTPTTPPTSTQAPTAAPTDEPTATPDTAPTDEPAVTPDTAPTDEPAATPDASGDGESTGLQGTLPEIIDSIYAIKDPGLRLGTMEPDLTDADALRVYTGLESADKLNSIAVSEAMIGSQAYSLVLVRLNDAADAKEVAEGMKAGINPRKWICVMADDIKVAACDDVVLFVMMDSEFKDFVTSAEIIDAFRTVCGGTFSVELN